MVTTNTRYQMGSLLSVLISDCHANCHSLEDVIIMLYRMLYATQQVPGCRMRWTFGRPLQKAREFTIYPVAPSCVNVSCLVSYIFYTRCYNVLCQIQCLVLCPDSDSVVFHLGAVRVDVSWRVEEPGCHVLRRGDNPPRMSSTATSNTLSVVSQVM